MDVPVQSGTYNCGLFAPALGKRPEGYHFDQSRMGKHLWQCFEERKMEMFPFIRQRRSKKTTVRSIQKVLVYCTCRVPEMGEHMVECTTCKQRYHVACRLAITRLVTRRNSKHGVVANVTIYVSTAILWCHNQQKMVMIVLFVLFPWNCDGQ